MSPCSGHGFKFGALMGRELARTIVEGRDAGTHARWAAGLGAAGLAGEAST
jgi:sarcosine oxidase subunit beta